MCQLYLDFSDLITKAVNIEGEFAKDSLNFLFNFLHLLECFRGEEVCPHPFLLPTKITLVSKGTVTFVDVEEKEEIALLTGELCELNTLGCLTLVLSNEE